MGRRGRRGKQIDSKKEPQDPPAGEAASEAAGIDPPEPEVTGEDDAKETVDDEVMEEQPSKKRKGTDGSASAVLSPPIKKAAKDPVLVKDTPELLEAENESAASWNQHLVDFLLYKATSGTVHVSPDKNKDLHSWVSNQRKLYAKHSQQPSMPQTMQDRFQVLETIHFPVTTRGTEHWMRFYEKLLSFKAKHGHVMVPRLCEFPGLGDWVTDQRRQFKSMRQGLKTTLDPERTQLLDDLGFVWEVRTRPGWDDRLEELLDYKTKNGDCKVPQHYKENAGLGKWVAKQREQFKLLKSGKHSFLTPDRLEKLANAGFVWSVRNEKTKYDDIINVILGNEAKDDVNGSAADKDKSKSPKKGDGETKKEKGSEEATKEATDTAEEGAKKKAAAKTNEEEEEANAIETVKCVEI